MRKFASLVFSVLFFQTIYAQEGTPLLTHFRDSRDIENQNWAITQDINKVMLFANRKGIISFDGEDIVPLRLQIIPYSMKMNPADKRIYIGGENNYGWLERDSRGQYRYVSLSGDSVNTGLITRILFADSLAWFYSENTVSCINLKNRQLEYRIRSEPEAPFTGIITNAGNAFINVMNQGLFRVEADTLFPIVTGYLTRGTEILFSLPYNKRLTLTGFSSGKISLFDGIKYYDYPLGDEGYIANNILSDGICFGDSLYAFSTLGGGAVVTEKMTGKVRFVINNQKGLPDDELFAIGCDSGGGLWMSHQFGLTRADLNLPVKNYGIYPGLKGNLTASLRFEGELYVATSEGLFYLANEKTYTEVKVLKRNNVVPEIRKEEVTKKQENTSSLVSAPRVQNTRKNLFTRIFGKKNEPETVKAETQGAPVKPLDASEIRIKVTEAVPVPEYTVQNVRKLKSIDYTYRKIDGLNEKCRQLVPTPNGILAATNRGLFVIKQHNAAIIEGTRYINSINPVPGKGWLIGASDGYFAVNNNNGKWSVFVPDKKFFSPAYSVVQTRENTLWIGSDNAAFRTIQDPVSGSVLYEKFTTGSHFSERYCLDYQHDTLFLFTESGINYFEEKTPGFRPINLKGIPDNPLLRFPVSNIALFGTGNSWFCREGESLVKQKELSLLRLFDNIVSVNFEDDNIWVVTGDNQLYGISRKNIYGVHSGTDLFIKNIRNEKGVSFDLSNIVFGRGDNVIYFDIVAPVYIKQDLTQYQFFINKVMTGWSQWSTQTSYSMGIPKPGDYTLLIRAKDVWGEVGPEVSILFTIKAPFTRTTFFYLLSGFVVLIAIFLIVRFRERQLQEKNRLLEEKVRERTAEIEAQKEEITSSIEYASRIQMAMLPVSNLFTEFFSDFFIMFRPRDIVSGDFYWIGEDEKNIYLTVADCTGHGVPGAFMSTLGISILNEIITHHNDIQANVILNHLREKIKTSLHQTGKEGEAADGMDISLCVLKKDRSGIQFAGAYNPLYVAVNGCVNEYKADRMPIGIHYGDEASFTNNEINISRGDCVYLLTDGLTDQFGGPAGCKFKKAQFRKLLSEICHQPMSEQKRLIENEFFNWKGRNEQVDDITIIGIRI